MLLLAVSACLLVAVTGQCYLGLDEINVFADVTGENFKTCAILKDYLNNGEKLEDCDVSIVCTDGQLKACGEPTDKCIEVKPGCRLLGMYINSGTPLCIVAVDEPLFFTLNDHVTESRSSRQSTAAETPATSAPTSAISAATSASSATTSEETTAVAVRKRRMVEHLFSKLRRRLTKRSEDWRNELIRHVFNRLTEAV